MTDSHAPTRRLVRAAAMAAVTTALLPGPSIAAFVVRAVTSYATATAAAAVTRRAGQRTSQPRDRP